MDGCGHLLGRRLPVDKAIILDWYDGIVEGFLKLEGDVDWMFCFIAAADLALRRRVYGLIPVPSDRPLISNAAASAGEGDARWDTVQTELQAWLQNCEEKVTFVLCETIDSPILTCTADAFGEGILGVEVHLAEEVQDPGLFAMSDVLFERLGHGVLLGSMPTYTEGLFEKPIIDSDVGGHV
jgi:hypothetical protein